MLRPLIAALALVFLAGCNTTSVSTVWKQPDTTPVQFQRIVTLVANATPAERRAGEDELVSLIKSTPAVASYTFIPDTDVADKDKVREAVKAKGFDGALIIRLVATDKQTTYVPPVYDDSTYEPYSPASRTTGLYRPGYTTTDTYVTAETHLYSVKDGKLIWAGSSTTENPVDMQDLVSQVAQGAAAELRKQGLLK
jgi:hypothetical protein